MSDPPPAPPSVPSTVPPNREKLDHGSNPMDHMVPTRNIPALTSWYLGVFGLIPILGIPLSLGAIVSGIFGIKVARKPDVQMGRGHAIAGIILGTLMGVLLPLALCLLYLSNPTFFSFRA